MELLSCSRARFYGIPASNKQRKLAKTAIIPCVACSGFWVELLLSSLLLALLFVFLATWYFLAHLLASLYVVLVVFVTLVNVGGFMHFWGLTIETATSIFLTISMGLCVDYSAHITHAFMVTHGESRNERMRKVNRVHTQCSVTRF